MDKRVRSWVIDYLFFLILFPICYFFLFRFLGMFIIIVYASVFLLKDILGGGRSIGKHFMGLEISLSHDNRLKAYAYLFRNITIFIWPIEILIILRRRDHRRIGDLITGAEVVDFNENRERIIIPIKDYVLTIIIAVGVSILVLGLGYYINNVLF